VTDTQPRPARILPVIVAAQFAGASIWFAGNAVLPELQRAWGLPAAAVGYVTSAVQLGFIAGTLVFAFLAIADRFSPRLVYLACSLAGAAANLAAYAADGSLAALLLTRFATGFFLAGIYPVGMKIASGWFRKDLGYALGLLTGALVLGTAFPHLLQGLGQAWPWQAVMLGVSACAALGGFLMFTLVPDGPYLQRGSKFDPRALASVFRSRGFRASAFGYFGHMWELYAFWAFVPVALAARAAVDNVSVWSFAVIAAGFAGCAGGGLVSLRAGSARVALAQLSTSGACCLLSPLLFLAPAPAFVAFLLVWGVAVVGDSPQFSALNAANAPPGLVGSALTIANCIGFAITIPSIELLNAAAGWLPVQYLFLLLVPGPVFGLVAMRPLLGKR
jgi:predicted MFS family arabinose efflux permease